MMKSYLQKVSKAFNDEFTRSSKFKFNKNKNFKHEENVKFLDAKDDSTILSDKATYLKMMKSYLQKQGFIQNKYNFNSKEDIRK